MVVVALLQLVFYNNRVAVLILGEEVDAEVTGGLLAAPFRCQSTEGPWP